MTLLCVTTCGLVALELGGVSLVDALVGAGMLPDWRLWRVWAGRGAEVERQFAGALACEFPGVVACFGVYCLFMAVL